MVVLERMVLRDVIMSFFIAGRDTTASTLSWLFLSLATHPEVAQSLLREARRYREADKIRRACPLIFYLLGLIVYYFSQLLFLPISKY